jgi:hypothetical protein
MCLVGAIGYGITFYFDLYGEGLLPWKQPDTKKRKIGYICLATLLIVYIINFHGFRTTLTDSTETKLADQSDVFRQLL